jgi:hypothetical protein
MMLMIPRGYETAEPGTMPDAKVVEAINLLKCGTSARV